MDDNEVNILEQMDGGGWRYRPSASSSESSYEIAAKHAEKLAACLGVASDGVQTAWAERFGTSDRHMALAWLRKNDIPVKTSFSWTTTDWSK